MTNPQSEFSASSHGLLKDYRSGRTIYNAFMTVLAGACLAITLVPLVAVLLYVLFKGFGRLNLDLFTQLPPGAGQSGGGLGNAIVGTIILAAIATGISVPIGVFAAVYMHEFSGGKTRQTIEFANNVLSGVPSILAGVFAYGLVVVTTGGFSAWAGGIALAVLMLPTIVRTTEESLKIVPDDVRWASVGVGASNYQTVLKVVLPAALPSIITGVMLAIARAAGETAPLIFTALNSLFWPIGLSREMPSLAVTVYNFATSPFPDQQELAWAGALIMVLLVLVTSILARWATSRSAL